MFEPIKAKDYWDGEILTTEWLAEFGVKAPLRPYQCETNRQWLLVWKPIPYDLALKASRDYYDTLPDLIGYGKTLVNLNRETLLGRMRFTPIRLWEPKVINPVVLEKLVERAEPYDESNFAVWEKYPQTVSNVYQALANRLNRELVAYGGRSFKDRYRAQGFDYPWLKNYADSTIQLNPFQMETIGMLSSFAMMKNIQSKRVSALSNISKTTALINAISQSSRNLTFAHFNMVNEE